MNKNFLFVLTSPICWGQGEFFVMDYIDNCILFLNRIYFNFSLSSTPRLGATPKTTVSKVDSGKINIFIGSNHVCEHKFVYNIILHINMNVHHFNTPEAITTHNIWFVPWYQSTPVNV